MPSRSVKSPNFYPQAGEEAAGYCAADSPRGLTRAPQKHNGRRIDPAPLVGPVKRGLGCEQFQAVAGFGFELVAVGRFLALDAVLGPRHRVQAAWF